MVRTTRPLATRPLSDFQSPALKPSSCPHHDEDFCPVGHSFELQISSQEELLYKSRIIWPHSSFSSPSSLLISGCLPGVLCFEINGGSEPALLSPPAEGSHLMPCSPSSCPEPLWHKELMSELCDFSPVLCLPRLLLARVGSFLVCMEGQFVLQA